MAGVGRGAEAAQGRAAADGGDTAQPELLMLMLQQVVDVALLPLPAEQALVELAARLRDALGGDVASIYLSAGQDLVVQASIGMHDEPVQERVTRGDGLVGRVGAERAPRLVSDTGGDGSGLRSLVLAPLVLAGTLTGVVQVGSYVPGRFAESDLTLLRIVADRVALAVEQLQSRERERRAVEALRESEARVRAVFDSAADGILIVQEDGSVESANPTAERMFGFPSGGLVGVSLDVLVPGDEGASPPPVLAVFTRGSRDPALLGRGHDVVARRADGSEFPAEVSVTSMDVRGRQLACAVVRDTTERTELDRKLTYLSRHDTLTGLGNRALLDDRLGHALARVRRHDTRVGVMLCDLDHFKSVNDSLGHGAGDALLVTIAGRLRDAVRPEDTIVRLGGDEFVIVCEDMPDVESLAGLGRRIVESVRQPLLLDGTEVFPTVSIGVALSRSASTTSEQLLGDADLALYTAKDAGRGRCHVFDDSMRARSQGKMRLRSELHRALERDEIVVHYQPLYDLRTGVVRGVEALMRWQHPTQGLLTPEAFLPLALESDLILDLDGYVVRRACAEVAQMSRVTGRRIDAWVNYSARTLASPDLCDETSRAAREAGLPAENLTIEVTESALLEDLATTGRALQELRRQRVRLAIDDFGAGHTALTYLTRLPVSAVKLDRTFTQSIDTSPVDRAVVRSVADLARALGLVTVAEGVETSSQLDLAAASGCNLGQGYLLARPVAYDVVLDLAGRPAIDLRHGSAGARGVRSA
ncbi:PAS domain S-box-containing protein/diguanylate cyclase (GGDEF)-like protein [Motilibacter rhizosphaerae]|uniref:PAS domain S-box-containing protein/diguanylate cyclase (GGDEF)-like protein n=1 Tax=Motilibacter rhizosphaerae TaxID=598652 RepID=A0A4Q7NG97_9ACTN|nr:EAL domain-containing protein [Motilibacter rhizosphaerae]RZS82940.1 PAS domain S-box-containing protein/diguanylate cyclase (GGDEF)-like protein [Motilibacter rhizosphaerae]